MIHQWRIENEESSNSESSDKESSSFTDFGSQPITLKKRTSLRKLSHSSNSNENRDTHKSPPRYSSLKKIKDSFHLIIRKSISLFSKYQYPHNSAVERCADKVTSEVANDFRIIHQITKRSSIKLSPIDLFQVAEFGIKCLSTLARTNELKPEVQMELLQRLQQRNPCLFLFSSEGRNRNS